MYTCVISIWRDLYSQGLVFDIEASPNDNHNPEIFPWDGLSIFDQWIKLCQTHILPWVSIYRTRWLPPLPFRSHDPWTPFFHFMVSPCHHEWWRCLRPIPFWVAPCPLDRTSILAGIFAASWSRHFICELLGIKMRHSGDKPRQFLSFHLNISCSYLPLTTGRLSHRVTWIACQGYFCGL